MAGEGQDNIVAGDLGVSIMDEAIKEITAKVGGISDAVKEAKEAAQSEIEAVKKELAEKSEAVIKTRDELELLAKDVAEQRKFFEGRHGKSGAEDVNEVLNKWLKGAYYHRMNRGEVPDQYKIDGYEYKRTQLDQQKAAADFTTTTDATAGYLVPSLVREEVYAQKDLYGNILPLTTKVTCPPGVTMTIPRDLALPDASWTVQGIAITEMEETFQGGTVAPKLVGSHANIANEMMEAPGADIGQVLTSRMLRAIVRAEEGGIIAGDTTNGAPHDGVIVETGISDQTNFGDDTHETLSIFITESLVDNDLLYNQDTSIITMHPSKWRAIKSDTIADQYGDVINKIMGAKDSFEGYTVLPHPACLITATYWACMFDPAEIIFANSGQMAVDFNPFGTGWHSNETALRVFTHSDWELGTKAHYSIADWT